MPVEKQPKLCDHVIHWVLFYCLSNADSFELWHVTVDNVEANLH